MVFPPASRTRHCPTTDFISAGPKCAMSTGALKVSSVVHNRLGNRASGTVLSQKRRNSSAAT